MKPADAGRSFEHSIEALVQQWGFALERQVTLSGWVKPSRVDLIATGPAARLIISSKWQHRRGSVEEKVVLEVWRLKSLLSANPDFTGAYLILGGVGWTLRTAFTSDDFRQEMAVPANLRIVSLEEFIGIGMREGLTAGAP